tara:strand:- start:906 stop:1130 length:225 start_codon:yes stop_codon:yes gene_type:complete
LFRELYAPFFFNLSNISHILKKDKMLKKELIGQIWNGKGFKIEIKDENKSILKKLGADVFEVKKSKKKKDDSAD